MLRRILWFTSIMVMIGGPAALATPIDLVNNASVTASDGTIWQRVNGQPTGTGVFEPFLRLQHNGIEQGLNTDFGGPNDPVNSNKAPYNDKSGVWTHSLTFGELGLGTVTLGTTSYYTLTLDINESANVKARFLSLDVFKIYAYNGPLGGSAMNISQLGTPKYDLALSNPTGAPVLMDYTLSSSGSGKDDMQVFIPVSKFQDVKPTDYFYLYSQFGGVGVVGSGSNKQDFGASAGFEEWRVDPPPVSIPEPATLLFLGLGLIGVAGAQRKLGK